MIPIRNAVPSRYPPVITWMLIATNCLVFLFQDSLSPDELELLVRQFALIPARYSEVLAPGDTDLAAVDILPFFSVLFLHGGWLHLILNMWTLWLFGPTIEDRLGPGRYLAFYLPCCVSRARHLQPDFDRTRTGRLRAIAGVLGCYMRLFPLARVVVVIPILFSCSSKPTRLSLSVCGSCFRFCSR
jgi:membrane associated rhomboid family serine protease